MESLVEGLLTMMNIPVAGLLLFLFTGIGLGISIGRHIQSEEDRSSTDQYYPPPRK
jgi:hypothetical protein